LAHLGCLGWPIPPSHLPQEDKGGVTVLWTETSERNRSARSPSGRLGHATSTYRRRRWPPQRRGAEGPGAPFVLLLRRRPAGEVAVRESQARRAPLSRPMVRRAGGSRRAERRPPLPQRRAAESPGAPSSSEGPPGRWVPGRILFAWRAGRSIHTVPRLGPRSHGAGRRGLELRRRRVLATSLGGAASWL
jgi:hypothetical protein